MSAEAATARRADPGELAEQPGRQAEPIRALVPTGFGINCEVETAEALRRAGAEAEVIHLNDLAQQPARLARCHILALAGGFSFGDHLGAGKVLANRMLHRLGAELGRYAAGGGLIIGICNGFQTMARMGLVPTGLLGQQRIALGPNTSGCFYDGWVTLQVDPDSPCVFTRGLERLELPVRHGEGRVAAEPALLEQLEQQHLAPLRYADPATGQATEDYPANPNGSPLGIAGVCDATGRMLGLMPHPEAFLHAHNHPRWRALPPPREPGAGQALFDNAVRAARG